MEFIIQNEEDLLAVAKKIWAASQYNILLFSGTLGAGKTALIKRLCQVKKYEEEVSSPSYSLINEYPLNPDQKIVHMDLYRLKDPAELYDIGAFEYLDSEHYVFVEWPEFVLSYLDNDFHTIDISILDDWSRKIIFQ